MRPAALVRRSIALTAATALMSGGLTSGFLATPAWAAPGDPATLNSVSPTQWDNRSEATLTLTGADFLPGDTVIFHPCDVQPWAKFNTAGPGCGIVDAAGAAAHEVAAFDADLTPVPTNPTGAATARPNLALAPAGLYYLTVKHRAGGESAAFKADGSPKVPFRIFDIGTATARSIAPGFDSTGLNCDPFGVVCDRGAGAIDITGSNFAIGADVQFLLPGTLALDPGISFTPDNPGNGSNTIGTDTTTGYPSGSLIQGNYAAAGDKADGSPGFTPGKHLVRVVNTFETGRMKAVANPTVEFWQPWYRAEDGFTVDTPIGANKVGVGAKDVTVTLKGRGIRNGARLSFSKPSYTSPCSDVTVTQQEVQPISPADVNGNDSKIVAKINVAGCTTPTGATGRRATVTDASGASFGRANQLFITPAPTVDNGTIATLGQGAAPDTLYQIDGTGFDVSSDPAVVPCPVFDFGPGVTATTVVCNASDSALVRFVIDQDAAVGNRTVTVTNPSDRGSSTQGDGLGDEPPLVIEAGPKIKTISDSSFSPPTGQPETVFEDITITGTTFEDTPADPGVTSVQILDPTGAGPDPHVTPFNVNVTKAGPSGGDDTLVFDLEVKAGAPAGQRILVLTNPSNQGRFVCACIAIDNLSVTPESATNTGSHSFTLTGTPTSGGLHLGDSVGLNSRVTVRRTIPLSGQPDLVATGLSKVTGEADKAAFTVDLTAAAPGKYSIEFLGDKNSGTPKWTCTGCLTVNGAAITTTKLTPSTAGQGATGRLITMDGTNFSRGMQVSVQDVTVSDVTFVSTQQLTFKVDVPESASTGNKPVVVTAGDGSDPATGTGSMADNLVLTVTAKPSATASSTNPSPNALGTGAGTASHKAANDGAAVKVTVTGDNFAPDATLVLGQGVTVTNPVVTQGCTRLVDLGCTATTPDKVVVDVDIAETATPGARDVTIVNGDGGRHTIPNGFTVNQGPRISSVTNELGQTALLPDGKDHTITVLGGGFAAPSDAAKVLDVLPADGVTITEVSVVSPSKITAAVTVATGAARGARKLGVTNTGDSGFGSATVFVATPPGLPGSVRLNSLAQAVQASWTAAPSNGVDVTGYHLVLKDLSTGRTATADVAGTSRSHTFSSLNGAPLVNGRTYELAINAVSPAGIGPVAKTRGVAGLLTRLTLVRSRTLVTSGSAVNLSGTLTRASSTGVLVPAAGRTVTLTFVKAKGSAVVRNVVTSSTGRWVSNGVTIPYNWKVTARYAGDSTYRPAATGPWGVFVASKVTRTFPANGSSSPATTTLRIAGKVAPSAPGKIVYLQRLVGGRWFTTSVRARLSSTSTFVLSYKPARGTYTFRIFMPPTFDLFKRQLNYQGYSPVFKLRRT